jgi:hypothetical protein
MAPPNPRFIFVSHAGEDTWVARQIAREISALGARPFLDEADIDVRDIIRLNDVGQYFEQLGARVALEKSDGRTA